MTPLLLDHDLGLGQRIEDLAVEQLVSEFTRAVLAFALPYRRKNDLPCAAWILIPGADRRYGETGSEVRTIVEQRWIALPRVSSCAEVSNGSYSKTRRR